MQVQDPNGFERANVASRFGANCTGSTSRRTLESLGAGTFLGAACLLWTGHGRPPSIDATSGADHVRLLNLELDVTGPNSSSADGPSGGSSRNEKQEPTNDLGRCVVFLPTTSLCPPRPSLPSPTMMFDGGGSPKGTATVISAVAEEDVRVVALGSRPSVLSVATAPSSSATARSRRTSLWKARREDSTSRSWRSNDGEEDYSNDSDGDVETFSALVASTTTQKPPTLPPPPPTSTPAALARQLGIVLLITCVSWNLPRYLIANETSIASSQAVPPYQVVVLADNQHIVVLNPELNHPLVDPPTIPSNLLVYTSLGVPLLVILVVGWVTMPPSLLSWATHSSIPSYEYSSLPLRWERDSGTQRDDDATKDKLMMNGGGGKGGAVSANAVSWMPSPAMAWLGTMHAALCGSLLAVALTEGPTQLLKLYVQRPRPNFYALCQFDATTRTCTAPIDQRRDATFSFPSGHSSLAASSMAYLSLFLLTRILHTPPIGPHRRRRWLCQHRRSWALLAVIGPLMWSLFVGASRIVDQWHHPSDVLAGLLLGHVGAILSYHYWFPPVWFSTVLPWSIYYNYPQTASK